MKKVKLVLFIVIISLSLSIFITSQINAQESFFSDFTNSALNAEIIETSPMAKSASTRWWVNSGERLIIKNGIGQTLKGESIPGSAPYERYKKKSDTDFGRFPQNIFRLVTKSKWKNYSQEVYFKMTQYNDIESPNRTASNGFFLFNRYSSGQTLYYVGLRVDGNFVIKKKFGGTYYTMSIVKILPGKYDRKSNNNLLQLGTWYGIKSEVENKNGKVHIRAFLDLERSGKWKKITEVIDDGIKYQTPIIAEGHSGIRTDFMDAEFKGFRIASF